MQDAGRWQRAKVERRRAPLRGPITKRTSAFWIARLLYLEATDKQAPILVELDSPGGPVAESMRAIQVLEKMSCPVAVHCHGTISGTALSIAAHGLKGCRTADEGTRFVFTPLPSEAAPEGGQRAASSSDQLIEGLAKAAGRPASEVAGWLGTGAEFDAGQAAAYGLIDTVSSKPVLPLKT
ncbi:MAG TPA: ATP-dependent Clp protease proteolytic subunit [Dongiaceae bacterium]|nr:ATP-dependent Clp protease proteolytic subunit [Dongiaceae bacterium]